jgi:hypothetical protein
MSIGAIIAAPNGKLINKLIWFAGSSWLNLNKILSLV